MATLSTSIATGLTLATTGTHASPFTITATGIVNAATLAGTYAATLFPELHQAQTLSAAVIGHTAALTLLNNGLIETNGPSPAYGAVFGAAGLISNTGTIIGPGDIALLTASGLSTVKNTGLLEASAASAILFHAPAGTVLNSGRITAAYSGIYATGGTVTNAAGAYISGNAGIDLAGTASLTNAGTIHGVTAGINDFASGRIANSAGGLISGEYGIEARPSAGFITLGNTGTITGSAVAVQLLGGGTVTNASAAHLQTSSSLGGTAVLLTSGGTVLNAGTITGGAGVLMDGYGTISLASYAKNSGTIKALSTTALVTTFSAKNAPGDYGVGIALNLPGSVVNSGLISATNAGIFATEAGNITNASTGKILGGGDGISLDNGGAALNQGTISVAGTGISGAATVSNASAGFVSGAYAAINLNGTFATLINAGICSGGLAGALALAGGEITNASAGLIETGNPLAYTAVFLQEGGTLLNAGTLAGGAGVILGASGTLSLPSYVVNSGVIQALGTASLVTTFTSTANPGDSGVGIAINLPSGVVNAGFITASNTGLLSTAAPGITNSAAGIIDSYNGIVSYFTATSTISNAGAIAASGDGIDIPGTAAVTNSGTIRGLGGTLFQGAAINIGAGTVSNGGVIGFLGYGIHAAAGTVSNTGVINAYSGRAIAVGIGSIYNSGQLGGLFGAVLKNTGAITNTGDISATDAAIYASSGGITNTGFAGGNFGALLRGSGTITNAGTLRGANAAVYFYNGNRNTLIAEPGAVFTGAVHGGDSIGGPGISLLELGAGTVASTLAGFGSQFTDFQTLAFAPGSSWTVEGSLSAFDDGLSIAGFMRHDVLDLAATSLAAGPLTIGAGGTLALTINHVPQHIIFAPGNAGDTLVATPDGHGGTDIACFVRGTRILTPRGNIAIEKLNIGDRVRTMHGEKPIRWIGRRAYAARFIANNPDALPIRVRRHAIALNIPARDLYVSPDHAILEGGVLIHAHLLQNGISIHQPDTTEDLEYFHLEFDTHTIIYAENFSVESFIDEGAGNRFQNSNTRIPTLKPQKPCLPRVFDGFHLHNIKSRIAARAGISPPTQLGALIGTIDECTPTLIRGWAQNSAAPEHPVTLEIISGGFSRTILANAFRPDLRAAKLGSGCHGFSLTLPNLPGPITLRRASDGAILAPPATRHCEHSQAIHL